MKIPNERKLQQILFNHLLEELYECLQAMYYKSFPRLISPSKSDIGKVSKKSQILVKLAKTTLDRINRKVTFSIQVNQ